MDKRGKLGSGIFEEASEDRKFKEKDSQALLGFILKG